MNISSNNTNATIKRESEKQNNPQVKNRKIRRTELLKQVAMGVIGIGFGAGIFLIGNSLHDKGTNSLNNMENAKEKCLEEFTPFECESDMGDAIVAGRASQNIALGYLIAGAGLLMGAGSAFWTYTSANELNVEECKEITTKKDT